VPPLKDIWARTRTLDAGYAILWFMVTVYPLLVIPHPFYISFPGGTVAPGYFYAPRYVALGLVALAALMLLLKRRVVLDHPAFIPLGLFVIFSMISGFLAPIPMTAWIGSPFRFTGLSTWYFCIILFILAYHTARAEDLLKWLSITGAVVSALALLQYFGINLVPHEPAREGLIAYGTLGHPNFLGTYTVFLLPVPVWFYLRSGSAMWLICSNLLYAALLVSLCRGAWLAGLVIAPVVVAHTVRYVAKKRRLLILAAVFALVTLLLLPARHGTLWARALSVTPQIEGALQLQDAAGSGRIFIWKKLVQLIPEFWAFGVGPDHLIYGGLMTSKGVVVDKAHNVFLEILVTMGTFTLLAYVAFLAFFLRPPKGGDALPFFAMVTAYAVQGLFNIDVVMNLPLFWITLGLAARAFSSAGT